ncbi:MAG TPA: hypothetical protein VIV12_14935 [Streptosporangiaceae bacterium]
MTDWLQHVRAGTVVEEIQLRPLSREEVAGQIAALVSQPPPAGLVDELYARGEGNPFFTEQLVAAAVADTRGGGLSARPALPTRLAELLVARVGRCSGDARDVLTALAVAGRPLTEALLSAISGLDMDTVGQGLWACADGAGAGLV